jgi:hypothetical protein
VPGAIVIILVLVIGIPVAFLITMGIVAAVMSYVIKTEVDEDFEGTEDLAISQM